VVKEKGAGWARCRFVFTRGGTIQGKWSKQPGRTKTFVSQACGVPGPVRGARDRGEWVDRGKPPGSKGAWTMEVYPAIAGWQWARLRGEHVGPEFPFFSCFFFSLYIFFRLSYFLFFFLFPFCYFLGCLSADSRFSGGASGEQQGKGRRGAGQRAVFHVRGPETTGGDVRGFSRPIVGFEKRGGGRAGLIAAC